MQVPGVISSVGLTVRSPSQLSTAVKSMAAGTSASHSIVRSAGAVGTAGTVTSSTVIVWLTLLVLSQPSMKVHVLTRT